MVQTYQTGYRSSLAIKLEPADTTMTVATPPTVTAGRVKVGTGENEERISFTGVSGSILTGLTRGLSQTADPATAGTGKTHIAGTVVILVAMHDQLPDKQQSTAYAAASFVDVTFTGTTTGGLRVKSLTTTQRDAISNAANGLIIYNSTTNALDQYVGGARTTIGDTGTITATTVLEGKSRLATTADLSAATAGAIAITPSLTIKTSTGAPDANKVPVTNSDGQIDLSFIDTNAIGLQGVEALVDKDTYITGEAVTAGQTLFIEEASTFALATSVQAISNVAENTRFSVVAFGSGTAGTTMNLPLKKFVAPTQPLNFRIETDNAGKPSGTLVDPDATATVLAASLTTSLANTTVTFAGTVNIPLGTKVHIVAFQGTYGSETLSATNYYGIGYNTNDTTIRITQRYDGANRYNVADVTDAYTASAFDTGGSTTDSLGMRMQALTTLVVTSVTKDSSVTATRCRIRTDAGTVIDTATFSGDIATFSGTTQIASGAFFRIECDASGASYTWQGKASATFPDTGTNADYITGSLNAANNTTAFNVLSIVTIGVSGTSGLVFVSSSLFSAKLLALTDASFTYKLPTTISRVATETVGAGEYCVCTTQGFNANQTSLTYGAPYYLSDTPGAISATAGTNLYQLGRAEDSTTINVLPKPSTVYGTVFTTLNSTQPNVVGTNTSSSFFANNNYLVTFESVVQNTASTDLQYSLDNSSWTTLFTKNGNSFGGNQGDIDTVITAYLLRGYYYRTLSIVGVTTAGAKANITLLSSVILS